MVEIATMLSSSHPDIGEPTVLRRESLAPGLGVALATLLSFMLWALLFNAARWLASGLF